MKASYIRPTVETIQATVERLIATSPTGKPTGGAGGDHKGNNGSYDDLARTEAGDFSDLW